MNKTDIDEYTKFFQNCTDKNIKYREILPSIAVVKNKSFFKKAKAVVYSGLSALKYPIEKSEPISALQRLFETSRYYDLLDKAFEKNDIIDKLAFMAAYNISLSSYSSTERYRPSFTPILGETYEFVDHERKFLAICEKISHEPPVTSFNFQTETWEQHWEVNANTKFLFTKLRISYIKKSLICSKKMDEKFLMSFPNFYIHNIMYGKPCFSHDGEVVIEKVGSKARVELKYTEAHFDDKTDCVKGIIYNDNGEEHGRIEGSYLTEVFYYKNENEERVSLWKAEPISDTYEKYYGFSQYTMSLNDPTYDPGCPTDSRYRKDMRLLEEGDLDAAASERQILEAKQNEEAKQRKLSNTVYEPKWFTKIHSKELNEEFYQYNGDYWNSKLEKNYTKCPNIF